MTTWTYWEGSKPPVVQLCLESIARHNVDCRVLGADEVRELGGDEVLDLTAGRAPWVRADLIRLWLLWKFGGQWIDADCVALRPLDMAGFLEDQCELVGFSNGAPHHFSNTILAAHAVGELVGEAYRRAVGIVERTPVWQKVPYGATGQAILGAMFCRHQRRMRRCSRWRYAYVHFSRVGKFVGSSGDGRWDRVPFWNPNACCYHLTGKGLVPFRSWSRERLLGGRTFLSFLFRRSLGQVRPLRAREILDRVPVHREVHGVEVGVLRGRLSRVLLQQRPKLKMTLVDLWDVHPEGGRYRASKDANAFRGRGAWERIYRDAKRNVAFAGERVKVLRMDSVGAAAMVEDGSLDFVFIDADHSYEGCKRDILAWAPKVRSDGWIAGHDYGHLRPEWGVTTAVDEWAGDREVVRGRDGTWFVGV